MTVKKIGFVSFFCLLSLTLFCQPVSEEYFRLCLKGESFYNSKKYKESGEAYSQAFRANGGKGKVIDGYNAACSWALAGYVDSAYYHLLLATQSGYKDYYHIIQDPDLISLQKDRRWNPLLDSIRKNKERSQEGKPLAKLLGGVYYSDQKYRNELTNAEKTYGFNSKEVKILWDSVRKQDAANLKLVIYLLDNFGWVGEDEIGSESNSALFLVIQHSDQQTQEKYLPMMREAVKKGNAQASSLALLEDRVALKQGKKQIYGSQLSQDPETGKYALSPIEDEANVNKRRAEVGLEPLEEYVKYWGIVYKPGTNTIQNIGFWQQNKVYLLLAIIVLTYILICFALARIIPIHLLTSP